MVWEAKLAIVLLTAAAMEPVAYAAHRWVMHGIGWAWHRTHHQPGHTGLEGNDLYALIFAALAVLLFATDLQHTGLYWVGAGMTLYGVLYALLHDVLVHRRLGLRHVPRSRYLRRLVQAHRLHHAVQGKTGCVSFGFLYAPPVAQLAKRLRA
jgi:beta-carotene 3-hydroxylase